MHRIVHLGRGRTVESHSRDFVDPTVARPRASIPRLRLEGLRRLKPVLAAPRENGPVRFVPGPLLAMRDRQCRWPLDDDVYCGARTVDGKSWCVHHDALAHGRLTEEAAE